MKTHCAQEKTAVAGAFFRSWACVTLGVTATTELIALAFPGAVVRWPVGLWVVLVVASVWLGTYAGFVATVGLPSSSREWRDITMRSLLLPVAGALGFVLALLASLASDWVTGIEESSDGSPVTLLIPIAVFFVAVVFRGVRAKRQGARPRWQEIAWGGALAALLAISCAMNLAHPLDTFWDTFSDIVIYAMGVALGLCGLLLRSRHGELSRKGRRRGASIGP